MEDAMLSERRWAQKFTASFHLYKNFKPCKSKSTTGWDATEVYELWRIQEEFMEL